MAGQNVVKLSGTLIAGPRSSASGVFPAGIINLAFSLKPECKAATVSTKSVRNVQSPSSFTTLHGVGPNEDVTNATFLFLQSDSPIDIRITSDDGTGGSVVSVVSVDGLCIVEKPAAKFIKLVEAQGTAVVEFFASGNQ